MKNTAPKFRHIVAALLIVVATGSLAPAYAIEPVSSQHEEHPLEINEATAALAVGSIAPGTLVKSREQVVTELLEAKRDGSFLEPSEIYPEWLYPQTTR